MAKIIYDRSSAADYARRWALSRNPNYYDFENIGGDCTNFASQCIYAGCGIMNFTPDTGWFYSSLHSRSAAWTDVEYLYRFLVTNNSVGPYGIEIDIALAEKGDIIQLGDRERFYHSLVVTDRRRGVPLVCAHSFDELDRPLHRYSAYRMRAVHIIGANDTYK